MLTINFDNPGAFAPLSEPVLWNQDQSPHRRGVFGAVVTQGAVESQAAGASAAPIVGDIWTVHAANDVALVADVAIGDTLQRKDGFGQETLTVQQIVKNDAGWWLTCTASERSPL